ncbi:thiamine phosphate synthase [Cupriavidus plantarum]|uniref:thiamine phosphate synthase n=1 Tax=Cupriavidus plantarum TaxID=942865 RepID=UPI000E26628B|nr:thiamine phosphate synthase [Cupriavidus plantarum]NYH97649.1 thiamine-phosphate pyrophosphorylase [Cupriavidus plantarum]REE92380.1 thiamine-phosphate diphosphorylase [Cupriavidus plantarum]CAG2126782.1 Thiamine-phosphate synthase [Cupriavidus plantarum]SMR67749.1 thiamine-phosphate diphosphorylase [Cupriavidus plantarum]
MTQQDSTGVAAIFDATLHEALLARFGATFGRDDTPWRVWPAADAPAALGTHDILLAEDEPSEDGPAEEAIARVALAGATLIATEREGGRWIDTVRSPMGTWVFESQADSDAPHSPAFVAVLLAARALHFPAHDALCLARAWRAGEPEWPSAFQRFPRVRHAALAAPEQLPPPFAPCPADLGLYAVVPTAEWIERLVPLGVPTVQLRFKSPDGEAVRAEVERAARAARASAGASSRLFINDHWRVAIELHRRLGGDSGIYGIHLGQEDLDDADLDAIRASGLRLGVSTHGYAEMLRVAAISPSYLALGAIFPTTTKVMPTAPQGMGRFQAYVKLMQPVMPALVGIGGVNEGNLPEVLDVGVRSAAVVRAITEASDVPAAVARLKAMFER